MLWHPACTRDGVQRCQLSTSQTFMEMNQAAGNSPITQSASDSASFAQTLVNVQSGENVVRDETQSGSVFQNGSQPGALISKSAAHEDGTQSQARGAAGSAFALAAPSTRNLGQSLDLKPRNTSRTPLESTTGRDRIGKTGKATARVREPELTAPDKAADGGGVDSPIGAQLALVDATSDVSKQKSTSLSEYSNSSMENSAGRPVALCERSKVPVSASDLAFAVKVQNDASQSGENPNRSSSEDALGLGSGEKAVDPGGLLEQGAGASMKAKLMALDGSQQNSSTHESMALPAAGILSSGSISNQTKPLSPQNTAPSAGALALNESAGNQGSKLVRVQLTGANEPLVELRFMETSGAISISVQSQDASLTKQMQQNIPELTGKLSDLQIRADWWLPPNPGLAAAPKSEPGFGATREEAGRGQAHGSHQENGSEQQDGRPPRQPGWVEELIEKSNLQGNGRAYSWQL